jgi:CheY-like chemotaxis protein
MLLGEIRDASERAAALTRQLLAFSRSQVLAPRVVDLNAAIGRVEGMLRRLIGEDIELVCVLAPDAGHVRVDPGQFEQVLLNLAVNARDAMPRGGKLTLESHLAELDEAYCRGHAEVAAGRYAQLAVSDTGSGMTAEVRERIFEPFFTTKAAGAGTGLGLSTAFGIVKQSAGHIEVESEVGLGSCFRIYLPQVDAPADVVATASAPAVALRGRETILLVEDEEGVRRIARIALESRGYRVLGAAEGRAALAVAEEHGAEIDLLVTDLVMPGMSGRELADALRVHRPGLRVLFMSGYVEDALVHHGIVEAEVAFLHKPFSLVDLAAKVREVLDAADGSAAPPG